MKQSTSNILMIQPVSFSKNAQTAVNNYYQKDSVLSPEQTQEEALRSLIHLCVQIKKRKGFRSMLSKILKHPKRQIPSFQ